MTAYRIASIPGDGIGVDVTVEARKVLDRASSRFGFSLEWTEFDWSCQRYAKAGAMMPDDGVAHLSAFDGILL
ncbi:MAG TPA: isocitrate/isopropylmalate family dehydrogenase, partial [Kribbella sp.]